MTKITVNKKKYEAILHAQLEHIVPKKPIFATVKKMIALLNAAAKKTKVTAHIVCGGSVAKHTQLANDYDCNIFVRLPRPSHFSQANLSVPLERILRATALTYKRVHGSRDYFRCIYEGISFEIVPVLKIREPSKAENVTDMSYFHVAWAKKRTKLPKNAVSSFANEIRLLKSFCKGTRTYGAESYIGGFSGHVVDILVLYYGSFLNVLAASQSWSTKTVLDVAKHYSRSNAIEHLNASKTISPIIIIDPLLSDRNAAAAVTEQTFARFCAQAKQFLQTPSTAFFTLTCPTPETMLQGIADAYCVQIVVTPRKFRRDVSGAKLKQLYEYILMQAKKSGFCIHASDWFWRPQFKVAHFLFVCQSQPLSDTVRVQGPPQNYKDAVAQFSSQHKNVMLESGRYIAIEPRQHTTLESLVSSILASDYARERCLNVVSLNTITQERSN